MLDLNPQGGFRPVAFLGPLGRRLAALALAMDVAGQPSGLFLAIVVVARHRNDGRIQDLPATRNISLTRQIPVELLEQRLSKRTKGP